MQRLRAISERLIPMRRLERRARQWKWEVNLIGSNQINAFCMPGGKIAVFTGILDQLQLTDDETAMVMGHEMAHALREHARERIAKSQGTGGAAVPGRAAAGLGQLGDVAANVGTQLLTLKFSRDDETEADLVGLEMAARAGYDPKPPSRCGRRWGRPPAATAATWPSSPPTPRAGPHPSPAGKHPAGGRPVPAGGGSGLEGYRVKNGMDAS